MQPGDPSKLGATCVDGGVNFALYSSVAERVELCLYATDGQLQKQIDLTEKKDHVWHGFIPGLSPGQRYGYRVHGPGRRSGIGRCNPSKLLVDPYARQLDSDLTWHASLFDSNHWDSAAYVPKGIVSPETTALERPVSVPWGDTLFYEVNVRGYTMAHPGVSESERGKFAGLKNSQVIEHIKSLGITSVELLPVHAFADEHHLVGLELKNFWGYNTLNFFAPSPRYSQHDSITEFRDMVNTLHDAGIEVLLDVVYNHTAESGNTGPTLSYRGIDEHAYYRITESGDYINDTGCGNTVDADSLIAQQLILDSLRYWTTTMGVDGFRFDLAAVLGRHKEGFSRNHPLLEAIASDPVLQNTKLVAEPWDPGPGGYQLGSFPKPWTELNDKFRDAARSFWRGDHSISGEFANRLRGSSDIFEASGRAPHASVNKITSHDGFTLMDTVSYEHKHNLANGENNRDGHNANFSMNYGVEGPTKDVSINQLRRQHRLSLLASLFLAQGTPFLLAGDEFGNSQMGNNNAYAQDNETGWLDWTGLEADPEFFFAVKTLIRIRKDIRLLNINEYLHGQISTPGRRLDIQWINTDGSTRQSSDWNFGNAFGMVLTGHSRLRTYRSVCVLFNAWTEPVDFLLPAESTTNEWKPLFSSASKQYADRSFRCSVPEKSVAVFAS